MSFLRIVMSPPAPATLVAGYLGIVQCEGCRACKQLRDPARARGAVMPVNWIKQMVQGGG